MWSNLHSILVCDIRTFLINKSQGLNESKSRNCSLKWGEISMQLQTKNDLVNGFTMDCILSKKQKKKGNFCSKQEQWY